MGISEADCKPSALLAPDGDLKATLAELSRIAPGVPLLALGQTIFWDEPMKAGVAIALREAGIPNRLVAGVHDTDYFAKLPGGGSGGRSFKAFPHNDVTTRGLWSAAGEFSALFGSETVITRDRLIASGVRLSRVESARPGFLQEATEAFGWRGIVSLAENPPITAEVPLPEIFKELKGTLVWAIDQSLDFLSGKTRETAHETGDHLRSVVCDASEAPGQTVSSYYRSLLKFMYGFTAHEDVDIDTTATSELLRFNSSTWNQPRFKLVEPFVIQATRGAAREAYDSAIAGSPGLYELARFGTGAIPFDLVIPGIGRGTIRLGTRGAVIMTRKPQFLSFKKPLQSLAELASLIEAKFGPDCILVGKAVTLIGMLGREFAFVFHEGASGYVKHSRVFHQNMKAAGFDIHVNPILRIKYEVWDALRATNAWLKLPEPMQRAFGTEEMCGPSFADRWREVGHEQDALLSELGGLRRPIDLLDFLERTQGGAWHRLAWEYADLHKELDQMAKELRAIREECDVLYAETRALRQARLESEKAKGDHFRAYIQDQDPTAEQLSERERLSQRVQSVIEGQDAVSIKMRSARHRQHELTRSPDVVRAHERRRAIELEAELKRARMIRCAVISGKGLASASRRPSAWWFPLLSPDGSWFRETMRQATSYLEPLL